MGYYLRLEPTPDASAPDVDALVQAVSAVPGVRLHPDYARTYYSEHALITVSPGSSTTSASAGVSLRYSWSTPVANLSDELDLWRALAHRLGLVLVAGHTPVTDRTKPDVIEDFRSGGSKVRGA